MISRYSRTGWIFLFIFICYSIGLWGMSVPLTGDQKVYLSIALEMKERGSFLIPYLFHQVNFLKPPFQYWATWMGWNCFGFNLFGALVPSVLAVIASAFLLTRISKTKSKLSALFFASTLGTLTYGTTAQMEIWIVFFYLLAWACWLEKKVFLALAVVGIMSWVKGPLYPVLWVLSLFFYETLEGRLKNIFTLKNFAAILIGAGLGLSWYGLAYHQYPAEILAVFFQRENLGKMQVTQGSPLGLWAEFAFSLLPVLPWFVLSLLSEETHKNIKLNRNFYLAYALMPALFFTFFPYRVNTYLYLLTPVAAWWMAESKFELKSNIHWALKVLILISSLVLSGIVVRLGLGSFIGPEVAVPLLMVIFLWAYAYVKLDSSMIGISSLLLVTLVRVGAIQIGEWDLRDLRSYLRDHPTEKIEFFAENQDIWHEFGLISAAVNQIIDRIDDPSLRDAHLKQGGAIIFSDGDAPLPLGLQCSDWTRLKRRLKFPLRELVQNGLSIEDTELHRTFKICKMTPP